MDMYKKIIFYLIFFISGFIVSLLYHRNSIGAIKQNEIVIRDTIIKSIPQQPIIIGKVKAKIIKTRDTILLTEPFIAKIDTIIRHDTVKAEYQYPEHLFSIEVRKKPDTIRREYITITKYIEREPPWWEKPALIAGSAALGFVAGRITK